METPKMADYDNLNKRLEEAKKEEAERGNPFRFPDGMYNAKLKDIFGKRSRNGNDMFVLTLKIRSKHESLHGKTMTVRFVKSVEFQFNRFLIFMEMMGVDLSKVKSDKDFEKIFSDIDDEPPRTLYVELKRDAENPQFENIYIQGVEEGEEDVDMSNVPAEAPKADAPVSDAAGGVKDESIDDIPF
jgi:hypothetical protein